MACGAIGRRTGLKIPVLWVRVPPRQPNARVAELVDALDSKSSARKGMWVRFPPFAPMNATCRISKVGDGALAEPVPTGYLAVEGGTSSLTKLSIGN